MGPRLKGDGLFGPLGQYINMAVPGQLTVYGDLRHLALVVSISTLPYILYDDWTIFRLLVTRMCLRLSGLNVICQSFSYS